MSHHHPSRRRFLGNMLALAGGSAMPFTLNLAAMGTAAAQTASDYKAIVCVYLAGGNDNFNTLLATDSTSWSEYTRIRNVGGSNDTIALPAAGTAGGVLPITPLTTQAGRSFALHPNLQPLRTLFDAGRIGIVSNVGTLIQPTTKAQYLASSVPVPPRLFSHNDQTAIWQSLQPEGTKTGWGGRMADMMMSANSNATFTAISNSGNALFLSGESARQFQISGTSMAPILNLNGNLYGTSASANPLRAIISADQSNLFQKEHAAVVRNAIAAQATLASAMPAAGTGVPNPTWYINPLNGVATVNPLAVQLQTIARIIAGRDTLGAKRQVFYVSLAGFDTHDTQKSKHADLMAKLAHAMAYFDGAMASLQGTDMRKQVTLFTASDFGRTFSSNGDGTDHGWGGHHFVMGGAVKGQDIYGAMPTTGLGHELDIGNGSLLPTTSVDQYGATLASWFGLSATQIVDVFPNIVNFSNRNLGFMS
jgi:uncharacterized protein (DUF1501 family)